MKKSNDHIQIDSISHIQAARTIEKTIGVQSYLGVDATEEPLEGIYRIYDLAQLRKGHFKIPAESPGIIIQTTTTDTIKFRDIDYKSQPAKTSVFTAYIKESAFVTPEYAHEISPDLYKKMLVENQGQAIATPSSDAESQFFINLVGIATKLVVLTGEDDAYKVKKRSSVKGGKRHGGSDQDEFRVTAKVKSPVIL